MTGKEGMIRTIVADDERHARTRLVSMLGKYPDINFSEEEQIGFVAQEIEDIIPQIVMKGSDGYYSVDYGRLTPLLVEAIKELKAENEELKNRIEALESR